MSEVEVLAPLQPGDRAPNIILDAATRQGTVALEDYRGRMPVLVGLFRGLHCPFCRRHVAAFAQLDAALRERGVETLAIVNTPIERARLYFRYHPLPNLLAASDPERISHRAFGLPKLEFTENETNWPYKVGMSLAMTMRVNLPGEYDEPVDPSTEAEVLNAKDGYQITPADERMVATGQSQLAGQFLLDREGVIRWTFTEAAGDGSRMFGSPSTEEVMTAAAEVAS